MEANREGRGGEDIVWETGIERVWGRCGRQGEASQEGGWNSSAFLRTSSSRVTFRVVMAHPVTGGSRCRWQRGID